MRVTGSVDRLVVVFGDQLNHDAAVFDEFDNRHDAVLMMEVEQESRHAASHRQRTVLFLAAMRHFALELRERGRRVQYVRLDDSHNTQTFDGEVRRQVARLRPSRLCCVEPGEWRVLAMVDRWREDPGIRVEILKDRHALVDHASFAAWADGRKSLVMEYFYREQRRRHGILLTVDGTPVGGSWNFDADNRKALRAAPEVPTPRAASPDPITIDVIDLVGRRLGDLPGRLDSFGWPVDRIGARRALRDFIEYRLSNFGTYQDAMWVGETTLYHSRLAAAMNLKLLHPMECVEAALEAYEAGLAPLNSVEGFVRQIIGWREFIRGIYWMEGPEYRDRNALDHCGALPDFYWSGETDMACMRDAIGQVLDEGYGHHIQRLMVTGNYALLSGVTPAEVNAWYLGMFVDGVDWVTAPNTIGMALHADGGVVGTKPYAASGKYIRRMSNACDACHFNVAQRAGADACPFNVFYWDFLIRHLERFRSNRRMTLMLKHVDRLGTDGRQAIAEDAGALRRAHRIVDR